MSLPDPNPFHKAILAALEPEVPESERPAVAWANVAPFPWSLTTFDQDGREIHSSEYGQTTTYGWHVHHRLDQALGGRHNRNNLMARHWLGNTRAGASLGALIRG